MPWPAPWPSLRSRPNGGKRWRPRRAGASPRSSTRACKAGASARSTARRPSNAFEADGMKADMGARRPDVSVVIPVLGDAERLALCLDALDRQTLPANRFEVIVVDNASDRDEAIAAVVAEHAPRFRLLHEPRPGSYAARNRAIADARGTIIAFTDADCIPRPDWLERGIAALHAAPR